MKSTLFFIWLWFSCNCFWWLGCFSFPLIILFRAISLFRLLSFFSTKTPPNRLCRKKNPSSHIILDDMLLRTYSFRTKAIQPGWVRYILTRIISILKKMSIKEQKLLLFSRLCIHDIPIQNDVHMLGIS